MECSAQPTGKLISRFGSVRWRVRVCPEACVCRPDQFLKCDAALRVEVGVVVDDGRDLGEGARGAELHDTFAVHEMVSGHAEPTRERGQAVDVGLTALGQAGERRGADA